MFENPSAAICQFLTPTASQDGPKAIYNLPPRKRPRKASVKHLYFAGRRLDMVDQ